MFSFSLQHSKNIKKNDDYDEVQLPSSKNDSNLTKVTNQAVASNIQVLQQRYESLLTGESSSSINNTVSTSNGNHNIGRVSNNNDLKAFEQQKSFEASCNIPSELISILKKEKLWTNTSYMFHVPTVLTSTERKRRIIEIDLLQNLINCTPTMVIVVYRTGWYRKCDRTIVYGHNLVH
jgi:hypothetical protein